MINYVQASYSTLKHMFGKQQNIRWTQMPSRANRTRQHFDTFDTMLDQISDAPV